MRASDNPHGVVEFQATSVFVSTEETSSLELTIIRQFGTFGEQQLRLCVQLAGVAQ